MSGAKKGKKKSPTPPKITISVDESNSQIGTGSAEEQRLLDQLTPGGSVRERAAQFEAGSSSSTSSKLQHQGSSVFTAEEAAAHEASQITIAESLGLLEKIKERKRLHPEDFSPATSRSPSPNRRMESAEEIRARLKLQQETLQEEFIALVKQIEDNDFDSVEVSLNALRRQVDKQDKIAESLIKVLVKDRTADNLEEMKNLRKSQSEGNREFCKLELSVRDALKKKSFEDSDSEDEEDDDEQKKKEEKDKPLPISYTVEDKLCHGQEQILREKLRKLEEAVQIRDCDDLIASMDNLQLQWEDYQADFDVLAKILRKGGYVDKLEADRRAKRFLQEEKVRLEWLAQAILTPPDTAPQMTDTGDPWRSFRHNRQTLPTLNGNVKEWLPFWSLFKEVHMDKKLPDAQKFRLLYDSTGVNSEAREVLAAYTNPSLHYQDAFERLRSLYERDNVLIKVYVRELLQLAVDKSMGKGLEFRKLVNAITAIVKNLEMLGVTADKSALVIYPIVEACLPRGYLEAWQRHPGYKEELHKLMLFCQEEVNHESDRKLAQFQFSKSDGKNQAGSTPKKDEKRNENRRSTLHSTASSLHNKEADTPCIFCNGRHPSQECDQTPNMTVDQREAVIKSKGGCYICLLPKSHFSKDCPKRNKVKCGRCGGRHYRILCRDGYRRRDGGGQPSPAPAPVAQQPAPAPAPPPSSTNIHTVPPSPSGETSTFSNATASSEVPLQMILITVEGAKGKKIARALLDTGSQKSYVIDSLAKEIGLEVTGYERVVHQLFGGAVTQPQRHDRVKLHITGAQGEAPANFDASCIPQISQHIHAPTEGPWKDEFRQRGVTFPDFPKPTTGVEVLIGNDVVPRLYTGEIVDLGTGPVAMKTRWGWVLCGKLPPPPKREQTDLHFEGDLLCVTTLLSQPVTKLWDLDMMGIRDSTETQSRAELAALTQQHFEETVKQKQDGRYQVQLPFLRGMKDLLPTNYYGAEGRLIKLTTDLRKKGRLQKYNELFLTWEQDGMIEKVDMGNMRRVGHYLPHSAVVKESSLTTPLRPVFDDSAHPDGMPSLNKILETGPNLLELIPSIVTRFRMKPVGVTSDIKKAFQQIEIQPDHRDYLRFMWWADSPTCTELIIYRHTRVVFGVTCSPYLLAATLNHHLDKAPSTHTNTASLLRESFYVDNCVASVATREEAAHFQQQCRELLEPAQFDLRGWEIGPTSSDQTLPVLGLLWDTKADTLSVDIASATEKLDAPSTQKTVLAVAHSLYDPMGMLSPFLLQAKLILRKCFEENLGWKKELPPPLQQEFEDWAKQIPLLPQVKLPRYTGLQESSDTSLHIFTDASKLAYAAVVYLRCVTPTGVKVSLLQAKSRVAPKKTTIPRLELIGCLVGARLGKTVIDDMRVVLPTTYWTDSSTAHTWITGEGPWAIFVNNRVKEIRTLTERSQWRHVPGKLNPADVFSRGCSARQLVKLKLEEGPDWLRLSPGHWPQHNPNPDQKLVSEEMKIEVSSNLATVYNHPVETLKYFGDYWRLLGSAAYWLRYRTLLHQRVLLRRNGGSNLEFALRPPPSLTLEELEKAEVLLIRYVQRGLQDDPRKLRKLRPFLDADGILRTTTRITEHEEDFIKPIILPDNDVIVIRLIREIHYANCHIGPHLLLAKVRERFWLINGRRTVRKIVTACWICQRWLASRVAVPEPPLPANRTMTGVPFNVIGVDLTGHLFLRDGKKVWVVLYTCASYRAVHLIGVGGTSPSSAAMAARLGEVVYNSKYPMNFTPNYLTLYDFEKFENHEEWRQWMFSHWHWSVYASVIYVVLVFYGQWWMKDKQPLKLRKVLTTWNVTLAAFSTFGLVRSAPELLVSVLKPDGFHRSVCFLENHNAATSFWGWIFALSKIVEFGDTAFIVLRKQPLIFLHWYHHMTVCIYCWFAHGAYDPSSRWFCTMNYLVHALMYSYYALRSLQIKLPRSFAMFLTCLQLSQMVVGLVVNVHSYYVIVSGGECSRPISNIYLALAMYFSYFLLFADFFYRAYLKKTQKAAKKAE